MPLVRFSVPTASASIVVDWPDAASAANRRLENIIKRPETNKALPMPSQAMNGAPIAEPTMSAQKPTNLFTAIYSVSEKPSSLIIGPSMICPIASPIL
jgi:hypothetical protein